MPDREGDFVALVQRIRETLLERLSDHEKFHQALNGDLPLEFEGLGAEPNPYLIERHEALIWKDPVAYNDELQRWQGAVDFDSNQDAIEHLKTTSQLSVFRDLVQAIKRRRVAPFVGAGSSACLGFPLWSKGLRELATRIEASRDPKTIAGCVRAKKLIDKHQYIDAGAILYRIDKVQVDNYVLSTYSFASNTGLDKIRGFVRLLPELATGCIITTNFDTLIEKVYESVGKPFVGYMHGSEKNHKFAVSLIRGDQCILKLHGDASDADTYIFSKQQYNKAYGASLNFTKPLAKSLRQIYISHSLLFLGCSLGQDRTLEVFKAVESSKDFDIPGHFAILEEPIVDTEKYAKEKLLFSLKIRPIWYKANNHEMIEKVLSLALDCSKGKVSV